MCSKYKQNYNFSKPRLWFIVSLTSIYIKVVNTHVVILFKGEINADQVAAIQFLYIILVMNYEHHQSFEIPTINQTSTENLTLRLWLSAIASYISQVKFMIFFLLW